MSDDNPEPPDMPLPVLSGVAVAVNPLLAGSKLAVKQGNTITVSPAMWELMRHANQREFVALMRSIKVVDLGPSPLDRPFPIRFTY